MTDYYAYDHGMPCHNSNCSSFGKPHPNCHCYSGAHNYAKGGNVCVGPHKPDCQYFKDGGAVPAHPSVTLGHAAVNHGLLGLMKNVGRAAVADSDKHAPMLSADNKLVGHLSSGNHKEAANLMHGHPLVGSVGKNNLEHIMERLGPSIMQKAPNPDSMRSSTEYLNSSLKGDSELSGHAKKLFDKKTLSDRMKPDEINRKYLKEHLQSLQENPEQAIDVAGNIGHYMPDHAGELGTLVARATNYFSSLKPTESKSGPLDKVTPPDKMAMQQYDRQLDIAQKPQLVFQHVADGTIMPQDVITVQTLYPALYKSMTDRATEALVQAETDDVEIPYRQKQALSILLNEPLDSTMTPSSMQAIMQSQALQQARNQEMKSKASPGKPGATEMSAIEKADKMDLTTLEARQLNRNK